MTIRERHNKGGAYYGWGNTIDFDMDKKYGGKIVAEVDKGKYKQDALTQAQIAYLRQLAREHDNKTGGSHDVVVTIYERENE